MTEKSIRPAFTANAGEIEMEIFLLSDSDRQEFHAMQGEGDRLHQKLKEEQGRRRPGEVHAALLEATTEHMKSKLRPPWPARRPRQTQAERQATAEHKVDRRHVAEMAVLAQRLGQERNEFLARKKQERLLREAAASRAKSSKATPSLKRDFDRSR